jgi:aspartyl-tRNA(Asn)/glutamyl-tRNA(Gln) amidotransferase subunit C
MQLSQADIKKVALLARLELSEKETEILGNQLSAVLNYIEKLDEVNTDNIQPTAQVTGLVNNLRQDEAIAWDNNGREAALKQAPELEDKQVRVRRVL